MNKNNLCATCAKNDGCNFKSDKHATTICDRYICGEKEKVSRANEIKFAIKTLDTINDIERRRLGELFYEITNGLCLENKEYEDFVLEDGGVDTVASKLCDILMAGFERHITSLKEMFREETGRDYEE